jgi:hypothetical protein
MDYINKIMFYTFSHSIEIIICEYFNFYACISILFVSVLFV